VLHVRECFYAFNKTIVITGTKKEENLTSSNAILIILGVSKWLKCVIEVRNSVSYPRETAGWAKGGGGKEAGKARGWWVAKVWEGTGKGPLLAESFVRRTKLCNVRTIACVDTSNNLAVELR